MANPVDRNLEQAHLGGFQPFVIDSGRADKARAQAGIGRAVAGAGMEVTAWAERVKRQQEEKTRIAEGTKAMKDAIELEERMGPEMERIATDHTLTPQEKRTSFEESFSSAEEEYTYADPEIAAKAEVSRRKLRLQYNQALDTSITKEEQAKSEANIQAGLRGLARLSVNDPEVAIARATNLIVEGGLAAGWDDAKIDTEVAKWSGAMEMAHIRRQMQDPNAVRGLQARLLDESEFTHLDPVSRTALLQTASTLVEQGDRERTRLAEKAERDMDRAEKKRQETNAAEFRIGILNGNVAETDLTVALHVKDITLRDFNNLLPALRANDDQVDNPDIAVRLARDVSLGLADEANVWSSYADGNLSKSTAITQINKASAVKNAGGVLAREDVSRQREFVDSMVGGIRGPLAILDSQSSQRVAAALRDYDDNIEQAYERSRVEGEPFDVKAIADGIVRLYQPDAETSLSALRRPRYADGPRAEIDVAAAKARTLEAYQAGEITAEEAQREAELLIQYEDILSRQVKASERRSTR